MSSIKQVKAQIFQTQYFKAWEEGCNPLPYSGVSTNFVSQGEEWFVPERRGGIFFQYNMDYGASAPTTDSVRTVRLKNEVTQETFWILGTEADWLERANGCCGETPVMPEITFPNPVAIEEPCCETVISESACTYTYRAVALAKITGQKYQLEGRCGGTEFTPAPPGAGFATAALALTWAQANWGAYGTFSAIQDDDLNTIGIKLVSETCATGYLNIKFLVQSFCLDITAHIDADYNAIKHNAVVVPLGFTANVGEQAQTVIDVIKAHFADGTLTAPDQDKINYAGTGVPVSIGNVDADGVYTPLLAFGAGACSEDS